MKHHFLMTAAPILLCAACAATGPSEQLVDARQAYENARTSEAAEYRPDAVLSARQALDRAERAHDEDPGSFRAQSLAYLAEREAQKARAWGKYEEGVQAVEQAQADYQRKQAELLDKTQAEKQRAESTLAQRTDTLHRTEAELEEARRAREAAERKADAAIESLQTVAKVKEEARGTVITLDGSVLFATGKSELLDLAKRKLDDVARALKDISPNQKVVIEGHTDSRGSDANNLELSRERAQAVREYLVTQGVSADRMQAVGRGESQPIATNDTPEGRANNRRVEIVVGKPENGSNAAGSAQPMGQNAQE